MKSLAAISLVSVGLTVVAYTEWQQSNFLEQQISDYDTQVSQLLTQIENNSVKNLELGRQLESLSRQLNGRDGQIAALSRQLELAAEQTDPDYQEMETQIRQQVRREMQASSSISNIDPRTALVKQLTELEPSEMAELLSLNGQFGDFISSLDISPERMDAVVNALRNLVAEQNQARAELGRQMQANQNSIGRSEYRQRIEELMNPEVQIEALSFELSESELDAFRVFQEQRRNDYNPFFVTTGSTSIQSANGAPTAIRYFQADRVEFDANGSRAIRVPPIQPSN